MSILHDVPDDQGGQPMPTDRSETGRPRLADPGYDADVLSDVFGDDEWRTGVTFWLDDRRGNGGEEYDEPTDRWFVTIRSRRPYGYQEIICGLTPELEAMVLELLEEAEASERSVGMGCPPSSPASEAKSVRAACIACDWQSRIVGVKEGQPNALWYAKQLAAEQYWLHRAQAHRQPSPRWEYLA